MSIIRGTTPTIKYTFTKIDPHDIAIAYLTIKQNGELVLEKDISAMVVGDDYVEWSLTQEETLGLRKKHPLDLQMRYRTTNGLAYATSHVKEDVEDINKDGEI